MKLKTLIVTGLMIGCVAMGAVPASSEITEPPHVNLVWVTKLQDTWIEIQTIDNYKEHQVDTIWNEVQQTAKWTCGLYGKEGVVVSQMLEVERTGVRVDRVYMRILAACVLP